MISYERTCLCPASLSCINQPRRYTPLKNPKIIRKQQLQLKEKHLIVRTNIRYDTHSDIHSLITLYYTSGLVAHLTECIKHWYEQGWGKLKIYRISSASFTMSDQLQIDLYFSDKPLLFAN